MTETTHQWTAIMRHGQAFRPGTDPQERERGSALTKVGRRAAASVGARLAETLADLDLDPADVTIACAPSPEAKDTAAELAGPARSRGDQGAGPARTGELVRSFG